MISSNCSVVKQGQWWATAAEEMARRVAIVRFIVIGLVVVGYLGCVCALLCSKLGREELMNGYIE